MRFFNSSGVSLRGLGGLVFGPDLRAFVAAVFFARDDAVAARFLAVEV